MRRCNIRLKKIIVYGVSDRTGADNTGGKPIWSTVARPSERARAPNMVHTFCISR